MSSPFLVTPQWLSEHLNDASITLLDARMSPPGANPLKDITAAFERAHIPGALYFDIAGFSDPTTTLPYMLPSPDLFSQLAGEAGISEQQTLVVYDASELFSAPRVWWTFRTFGVKNVYVLDGGLAQWQAAGYPIETGAVTQRRLQKTFNARFDQHAVRNAADVFAAMENKDSQILDARSVTRFSGTTEEPRSGLRAGHIPGSINVPYAELLEKGKLKSLQALRQLFQQKGVDPGKPIITSCGSGITAAILVLALQSIGAKKVSLYDGSWAQWGASDRPLAQSSS